MEAFSTSLTLCFKEVQVCTKIRVMASGTLLKSGLRIFLHGISIVELAINLARERWTLRVEPPSVN